jgi:hypothetical protein
MIPLRDQLPKSWKGLKNLSFDLPVLMPNDPSGCPRSRTEILEYLAVEAPGGSDSGSEAVVQFDLHFVTTALVNGSKYWLWRFEAGDDLDCYVAVQETLTGDSILGFDEAFGLSPEQWLVLDYYGDEDWDNEE